MTHQHVIKICRCGWRRWPKCAHAWHFSYKPRGREPYRFSLDVELGQHVESKIEIEKIARDIREAIDAGTFRRRAEAVLTATHPEPPSAAPSPVLTLDGYIPIYIDRVAKASGKTTWKDDEYLLNTVANYIARDGRRLGTWALTAITEDELEAFHAALRGAGRAAHTLNHYVQVIKKAFRWATKKGYLSHALISDASELKRAKGRKRQRRLAADEETRLLAAAGDARQSAGVRLQGLIIAALETGCRLGELLALTWANVDLIRRELTVRDATTKDGETRVIPITGPLLAVLELAQLSPLTGLPYPPGAFVFGELGLPVKSIDKAWATCVLRAHGEEPTWSATGALDETSQARLKAIDLHFHDLRHEAGSRWLEGGMPLHEIRELLGHANLSQTDTYLNAVRVNLHASMKRYEDFRCKNFARNGEIEHRPSRNAEDDQSDKTPLH